jgi:phosphate-selective porin OprO/OprP
VALIAAWNLGWRLELMETVSQRTSSVVTFILLVLCSLAGSGSALAQGALTIASADGANQLSVRGYAQIDARAFVDDDHDETPSTFLVRRARIFIDGSAHDWIRFRITPDFAGSRLTLFDAYFEARFAKAFVFRGGKFKVPVGLERLQVGSDLRFVERAFPTVLAPNRDIGVGLSGDLAGDRVSYSTSFTNGVPDGLSGDTESDKGKDFAGRVMVRAWGRERRARLGTLSVGIAGTRGLAEGTLSQPGLPVVEQIGVGMVFRYRSGLTPDAAAVADGTRGRVMPQATYYRGPLGVMAEYIRTSQDVTRGAERTTGRLAAWQVAGSWIATGEENSFQGIKPANPLAPGSGHWGALELAVRYHAFDADESLFPVFADPAVSVRSASAWDLSANWYWNAYVKFMVNYEQTTYKGGAPVGDRPAAHLFLVRMQFSL